MTKEETIIGEDRMQIDGHDLEHQKVTMVPTEFCAEYLKVYYGKLFPYADIYRWLSYGNDGKHPACDNSYFGRREFAFTLENDIFVRFQSYDSATDMKSSIREKCPSKFDIGSVYSVNVYVKPMNLRNTNLLLSFATFLLLLVQHLPQPAKRHAYAQTGNNVFVPVERELVFDIDMSDYDDVRYCCSGADVCRDCWPLMTIAIKVLDTALRDDFGFNHILWVYSGRRGVHCWVCDDRARRLSDAQRASVADYFRVYMGGENSVKKVILTAQVLHPHLARSYTDVLKGYFEEKLLTSQQLLASEEKYLKILEIIPDESIASELHAKWQANRGSSISKEDVNVVRWEQLKNVLQSGKQKGHRLRKCVEEIIFTYTYPRLDMEVSKHMNHLLKAPFCVHPKTGRVCIPINPNDSDDFDPATVPTLSQLLEELNMSSMQSESEEAWERTSLGKSIKFFRTSFLLPLLKSCKEEMENMYNSKVKHSNNVLHW